MDNLRWLGLFSDDCVGQEGETAADAMVHLLKTKLGLGPSGRDMVVLVHELEVVYPGNGDRREKVTSTMIEYGEPGGFTAMSKTVGLPAAIATELVLTDELPLTGSHLPTHPAVYEPILAALVGAGLKFNESVAEALV
jgi:saccharopine dehydrogenase-like NADP-dependent oxidoreductase